MRVHDVERVIVHIKSVEVADRELDIRTAAGVAARLIDHIGRHIDAEDPSGRDSPPDIGGDCAGPASEVEHTAAGRSGAARGRRRSCRPAPLVRPQYALVVTVRGRHQVLSLPGGDGRCEGQLVAHRGLSVVVGGPLALGRHRASPQAPHRLR